MSQALLACAIPVFVIASVAMPAGVGGGMLYVPLLILTGVADPRSAAVLSQPIIVGAALAGNIFNIAWQVRHPEKLLLDSKLALAMVAPCLAGNLLGTILNQSLPAFVILIMLLLLITKSFSGSVGRARTMWTNESSLSAQSVQASAGRTQPSIVGNEDENTTRPPSSAASVTDEDEPAAAVAEAELPQQQGTVEAVHVESIPKVAPSSEDAGEHEEADLPYQQVSFFSSSPFSCSDSGGGLSRRRNRTRTETLESGLPATDTNVCQPQAAVQDGDSWQSHLDCTWLEFVLVWIAMLAVVAIRGGDGHSIVGLHTCSWEYWLVTSLGFLILLVVGLITRRSEAGTLTCVAVGCFSACVGIGGAIVLNPMMVKGGVDVQTATATASLLVLVMSSCVSCLFLLGGVVPLLPAVTLSAAAFLGSLAGKSVVAYLVKRTGRTSVLVILLAGFILVSGLAVFVQTIMEMAGEKGNVQDIFAFKTPC